MRLAIFLLFCVGLAAAVPLPSSDIDDFDGFMLESEGDGIGERLKEHLQNIIDRIKRAVDEGKGVRTDLWERAKDFYEKLKNLGVDFGEKLKNAFEELRNKIEKNADGIGVRLTDISDIIELQIIIDRIRKAMNEGKGVRADLWERAKDIYENLKNLGFEFGEKLKNVFEEIRNRVEKNAPTPSHGDITDIRDMFKRLKQLIKEKLNSKELKERIEKIFGKGNALGEQFIKLLKENGESAKQLILEWLNRFIPDKEERSISEVYKKLKEFFKELQLDLKERFTKFGEWVKEKYEKGMERGKTRAENIKRIAKEFLEDSKVIGKDMAEEARDFFRQYKEDLGKLYDEVVEKVREIVKS